jgi:hypothetical protein
LYLSTCLQIFTWNVNTFILFSNYLRSSVIDSKYLTYKEARAFAVKLNLKSSTQWLNYCKGSLKDQTSKPDNIPVDVASFYKGCGWISWYHFLGNRENKLNKLPFKEARDIVQSLEIKTVAEYNEKYDDYNLRSKGVPKRPMFAYRDSGWVNWRDYLGKD